MPRIQTLPLVEAICLVAREAWRLFTLGLGQAAAARAGSVHR